MAEGPRFRQCRNCKGISEESIQECPNCNGKKLENISWKTFLEETSGIAFFIKWPERPSSSAWNSILEKD